MSATTLDDMAGTNPGSSRGGELNVKLSPSELWPLFRKVSVVDVGVLVAWMMTAAAVMYLLYGVTIIYL